MNKINHQILCILLDYRCIKVDELSNLSNTYTRVILELAVAQLIGACYCFTLNHWNSVLPRAFNTFKIHFDVILSFMPTLLNGVLPSGFLANIFNAFLIYPEPVMCPRHHTPRYDHANNS